MVETFSIPEHLVCPKCRGPLRPKAEGLSCPSCAVEFVRGDHGFIDFGSSAGGAREESARLEGYASHQEGSGERLFRGFLEPWAAGAVRILDAGCGVGAAAEMFVQAGSDAYGVDLPKAARYWKAAGRDQSRFYCSDVTAMPFADGSFDAVLSLGVVEHIGTVTGHCTLAPDYSSVRSAYARELLRVTRPGGRLLITCPNKSFPFDLHHGPGDAASRAGAARSALARRTGLNLHKTWGRYHLLSHGELRRLFSRAGASEVRLLSAKGYFSFEGIGQAAPSMAPLVRAYVERLPPFLRGGALDPFLIAEIRK